MPKPSFLHLLVYIFQFINTKYNLIYLQQTAIIIRSHRHHQAYSARCSSNIKALQGIMSPNEPIDMFIVHFYEPQQNASWRWHDNVAKNTQKLKQKSKKPK